VDANTCKDCAVAAQGDGGDPVRADGRWLSAHGGSGAVVLRRSTHRNGGGTRSRSAAAVDVRLLMLRPCLVQKSFAK